ncbi:hypothetical protein Tco_0915501 [Tanacetum coccineum]
MTLKNRYNTNLARNLSKQIYSPFIVDWNVLSTLGCDNVIEDMLEVRVNKMGNNEVLFTSEAWKRAFDINEPIYTELCHEFYATFEFDEAVADDELMMKKAIKFRLCGKAYAMSILDFAKRLGLYTGAEIQEYGFETYFIRGLRNDDDFSADQYWLNISSYDKVQKNELWLLSMFEANHQNGYANVTWLIAKWMKKKEVGTQTLNANILRELIIQHGRLIFHEKRFTSIPRVVTPRAQRHTTSDLYDKISQLVTRIGKIERMVHRQSYHSNRYARVLEHIASHLGVTLRDPYGPPSYFEQQQQQDEEE